MKRFIIDDLLKWKKAKDRKPLILNGARQVGKTWALKEFGRQAFSKVHYLNFEKQESLNALFQTHLDPQRIIRDLELHLNTTISLSDDLLIFDEIQSSPKALTSLKYFQEEMPELAFCTAGSLLGLHLNETSFPVGKVDFLYLYPMCFEEFLLAIEDERASQFLSLPSEISNFTHQHLWDRLKQYFVIGGMPEIVLEFVKSGAKKHLETFENIRLKQETLITTYIADMAKHSGKISSMHIERVFKNVPAQLARSIDHSVSKYRFTGEIPGLKRYSQFAGPIDWLKAAGLVTKVSIVDSATQPLKAHQKENTFKLYLIDVGLLGCLANIAPKLILDYGYGTYQGYFAENFVAQELLCTTHYKRTELTAWNEGTAEIEFLLEKLDEIIPLEVKSGQSTRSKSLQSFSNRYQPKRKIIFSAKTPEKNHGIEYWPLYLVRQIFK